MMDEGECVSAGAGCPLCGGGRPGCGLCDTPDRRDARLGPAIERLRAAVNGPGNPDQNDVVIVCYTAGLLKVELASLRAELARVKEATGVVRHATDEECEAARCGCTVLSASECVAAMAEQAESRLAAALAESGRLRELLAEAKSYVGLEVAELGALYLHPSSPIGDEPCDCDKCQRARSKQERVDRLRADIEQALARSEDRP